MSTTSAKISVIVPCFNDEKYIEECLDSLSGQTLKPYEVVICDDGSRDSTLQKVQSWIEQHQDIAVTVVAHENNLGIPKNLNSGIRAATGNYISLLAADDFWYPEKLEKEFEQLNRTGRKWAYSKTNLLWMQADGQHRLEPYASTAGNKEGDIFEDLVCWRVDMRNFLVAREALDDVGWFDESIGMYEDWDLYIRLARKYEIAHVPEYLLVYRQHAEATHFAPMYRHLPEIGKVLRKTKCLMNPENDRLRRETFLRVWAEKNMHSQPDKAAHREVLASLDLPYISNGIGSSGKGITFILGKEGCQAGPLKEVFGSHPDVCVTEQCLSLMPMMAELGAVANNASGKTESKVGRSVQQLQNGSEDAHDALRRMLLRLYSKALLAVGKSQCVEFIDTDWDVIACLAKVFSDSKFLIVSADTGCATANAQTSRLLTVSSDALVGSTLSEVKKICAHAGLPFHPSMLGGYTESGKKVRELNEKGEKLFGKGRTKEAKQAFLAACELDPDNVDTCNNLVALYWELKDQERALHYLAKALEVDPYHRDTIVNAGHILIALNKTDDARALCRGYLDRHPDDSSVTELLAALSPDPDCPHDVRQADGVLVTAIVSTYNSEQYIRGCLEDLEAQTIADRIEIIVVDSGSEQDERAIVAEFQQRYSNIRYIRTDERETIYAAWNRAISEANGKYLTNANTDDRHLPGAYERLVSELETHTDIALVYADSAVTRVENAGFSEAPIEANFRWPDFDPRHLFSVCYIGPQPMWRRSVHERYGSFDAEMTVAGDYDFWLRMAGTEIFRHVPEVLGLYLISANSIEHAFAGAGAAESETARQRNWPAEWGKRPELCKGYLVPVERDITSSLDNPEMENPYISIIMPTKDRLQMLGRALDSVVAQSYRNWELIVVNDGGESIRHIVNDRNASGRIRCIEFGWSRGQAAARNTAFSEARGEVICYLDDDDIYLSDHLQIVANEMASEGNSFIYTDAIVVKETVTNGEAQEVGRSNPYAHGVYSRERLLVNNYIPINTWAHSRSCLDEIGSFDDTLSCYEDWEFLLRLAEKYGFRHVEKTTVEVRHRVDKIDNVSRQRLGDTEQAYRDIYKRHEKLLTDELRAEREGVLGQLARNIDSWTAEREKVASESELVRDETKDSYTVWREQHDLSDRDIARFSRRMMTEWTIQPSIHLVMTHIVGQEAAVADTLDSLTEQLYGGWGLTIVSNAPCPDPVFGEMDNLEWQQVDGDLLDGVNTVIEASGADWLGLLEAGSVLEPHLLFQHVDHLHRHPEWQLVYMDEDRINGDSQRYDPLFKPEFNLELLRAIPYMGNFILIEREALRAAGGYARQTGAEVYDTVLRVIEICGEQVIGHIPDVLVHRQDRFQLALDQDLIVDNRRACVSAHLERCGIAGEVKPGTLFGSCFVDYACTDKPPVEIIVPASGKLETLELFLDSLLSQTQYPNFQVKLLMKESDDIPVALSCRERVTVVSCSQSATRWQAVLELARSAQTEYLMLMSPGAIAIQPNWLERLVAQLNNPGVAVVAPRLVSSDKTVVGGGVVTGAGSYSVGMGAFGGLAMDDSGYMGRAQVAQELSAVSNSCMLVRKSVLVSAEGLSSSLRLAFYQAVDFCLRVSETGGKIVWTPHSTLMFVGEDQSELDEFDLDQLAVRESGAICEQSLSVLVSDPAYSPNLALSGERFSVNDSFIPTWKSDDHILSRIVGFSAGSIGSWKFRIQQPLNVMCRDQVANSLVLPFDKELVQWPSMAELERLQPDTLLMHNTMHDAYMDSMEAYKKINKAFIVFGQDDLMFALPPKNPFSKTGYKDTKKRLRRCLGIADRLIVTTEPLADELRSMIDDIRVVPNYLDETVWGRLTSERSTSAKPRVGWAGAQQHLGDLELLEEVVRETAQEVDWVFFGMCPDFLQPYVKEIHNPVTFGKYPEKLASLNLDLALAPLEYNRFNSSKSNLRILEYGALGWPVIASDIAPYREAPVCRVPNQPRAWIKAIREHIHDMDATRREGDALLAWVRENWMLQQHMNDWLAALDPAGDSELRRQKQDQAAG